MPGGGESEEDAGRDRERQHAGEGAPVELDGIDEREIAGIPGAEERNAAVGEDEAADRAEGGEQDALGEELADQASAAGAEAEAEGHFAAADGGAGERQVGDVDDGDQEDESDRAGENQHRRARVADDGGADRDHGHRGVLVRRILPHQPDRGGVELALRLLERRAGFEARDAAEEPGAEAAGRFEDQVGPDLDVVAGRAEGVGHDADDGGRDAVDESAWPRTEGLAPKRRRQSASPMTAVAGLPGRSSSAWKTRPTSGATRMALKKPALTRAPKTCSGSPAPTRSMRRVLKRAGSSKERLTAFHSLKSRMESVPNMASRGW